ncbi:7tm 6 domain containing protein, partial [Asbolus verrucosus]
MDGYEWKAIIKLNISTLKLMGLWPNVDEVCKLNFYTIYTVITIILFMNGSVFFQIMYVILVPTDLDGFTEMMFIILTKSLVCIKALCLLQNVKEVNQILTVLGCNLFRLKTEKQWRMIQPALFFWKMTYLAFWSLAGGTIIMWSILPILDKSFKEYKLPFPAWYPYNTASTPLYEITYFHQVFGVFIIATTDANMDTLCSALMMFVGAQCDILCDDLRNLQGEKFDDKLLVCIRHHKLILSFAENSNKFFNMVVLGQFFTASVNIAMAMYRLSMVDPLSSESYSLLFYMSAITVQLFLYCWFGNEAELKV